MNSNQEKIKELFDEIIREYKDAEEYCIFERSKNIATDMTKMNQEINNWEKKLNELLK